MGNIGFILIQGILGAFAGYITNTYAVNMLFKEYTPLKLGGVVKKNKEKFVDEISSLVEEHIINGNTLKDRIASEEFKEALDKASFDFFSKYLIESIKSKKLKEIPGYNETINYIENYINSNFKKVFSNICDNALENFNLEDILKKEYIDELSGNIYDVLLNEAENNKEFEEIIKDIYYENSSLCLNDILSENTKSFIKDKLKEITKDCIYSIINDSDKFREVLDKLYNYLDIDDVIDKLQKNFKEKTFSQILNEEDINTLSNNLYEYFNTYLNSGNGDLLFSNVLNKILEILKEVDSTLYNTLNKNNFKEFEDKEAFTLYDIIPKKFEKNLFDFINKNLNEFLPYIAEWIRINEENFNELIEESIDEGIGDLDEGLRKKIIELVRKTFLSDVASSSDIIGKILNYMNDEETKEDVSKELTEKIIAFLKETTIKDLIKKIESSNVLNSNIMIEISNLLKDSFSKNGKELINKILIKLSLKKIGTFLKVDLKELFNEKGKNKIYEYIIQNKALLREKIEIIFLRFIDDKYSEVLKLKLKRILKEDRAEKLSKELPSIGISYLKNNKSLLNSHLNHMLKEKFYSLDLKELYKNNEEVLNNFISNALIEGFNKVLKDYESDEITNLISKVPKKETISFVSEKGHDYLKENAENLLKGKVKKVIYDNLIRQNEDEICDLAQRFMGNQLKPISIFGGALGLSVGIIFGGLTVNASLSFPIKTISSCIVMALIGVLTNVIAIGMLFKPYTQNRVLAKIPLLKHFSLGYIPAHKENLSNGVGNVIDKELLNGESLKELFKSKKVLGVTYLSNYIKTDNYKIIFSFINKKSNDIISHIYNFFKNMFTKEKTMLKYISNTKIGIFLKKSYFNKVIEKVKDFDYTTLVSKKLEKFKNDKKNIKNILSEEKLEELECKIDEEILLVLKENYSKVFKEEFIKNIIFRNEDLYNEIINKSLSSMLSYDTINDIKEISEKYIKKFIFSDLRGYTKAEITNFLSSEIDGEKTIGNVFNGTIKNVIDNNFYKIGNFVVLQLVKLMKDKKDIIKSLVKEKIMNNLNFVEKIFYKAMKGEYVVENCIDVLIDKKIKGFINDRVLEISGVLNTGLNNVIYPKQIKTLQLKASEINTDKLIDGVFNVLESTNKLKEDIDYIINLSLDKAVNIKFNTILCKVNLDSLEKIYNKFNGDIVILLNELNTNFDKNINKVSSYLNLLIKEYFITPTKNLSLYDITYEDIKYTTDFIIDRFLNSRSFNIHVENISNKLYDNMESHKISYFLSYESIENIADFIFTKEQFNLKNIEILNKALKDVLNGEESIIDDKTKDYLISILCESFVNSGINNMKSLIEKVHLKEVTTEQIIIMDSKEIHELFKSFAGEFFNKLYLYGSFGFVFGINIYLSVLLTIAYFINDYQVSQ